MIKGTVVRILNHNKREGASDKGPWKIIEVEVEKEDGSVVKADSFDTLVDRDTVELKPNSYTSPKTGKTYEGWNASIPKANHAPSGGPDNKATMEAVRILFREVKEVNAKLDEVLNILSSDDQKAADIQTKTEEDDWIPPEGDVDNAPTYHAPDPAEGGSVEDFMNE